MKSRDAGMRVVSKLMLRLLPVQILLAAIGAIEGIISSYFASNYVGIQAMSAVGIYSPITMLFTALGLLLGGGSSILCGRYLGRNDQDGVQNVFSLNLRIASITAALFTALFLMMALFDLTGVFTRDAAVRPLFNQYLLGKVIGVFPVVLSGQLPAFLSIENRQARATIASLVYIAVDLALNILFVQTLRLEAFGLALASSLSAWVFFAIQIQTFMSPKSSLHLRLIRLNWQESLEIIQTGLPGAAGHGYQTLRGVIVNRLLALFVGSVGISAFAAANSLLAIFWAIPTGMQAVSRMMIGIYVGEEDRQSLTDVMRVMFRRFVPMMCVVCAAIMLCAEPFTRLFFQNPAEPVYEMTVWGFRLLPLCMPLSIICTHFVCYGQASGKQMILHVESFLDGVACVALFSALLIPSLGINGVYIANILNGVVCALSFVVYASLKKKRLPANMEELMVIPEGFGAPPEARMDLSVQSMDGVVTVSRRVTEFCIERGIDKRRAGLAGLCLEEMAGNIVSHGFTRDGRRHSIDIRVVHKDDFVIMRIRDDCVPFDPQKRRELTDPEDIMKNVGIRIVCRIAESMEYQNLLGLNVLTIRI